MKKRVETALVPHLARIQQEEARRYLSQLFGFIEDRETDADDPLAEGFRRAVFDILGSTYDGRLPGAESLELFHRCLNLPTQATPRERVAFTHKSGRLGRLTLENWESFTDWRFESSTCRWQAENLRKCLSEFHRRIFVWGPTIGGLWGSPLLFRCLECGKLFLKTKSDQRYCCREHGRKYDYENRLKNDPDYYRTKAAANYEVRNRKKKRRKRRVGTLVGSQSVKRGKN